MKTSEQLPEPRGVLMQTPTSNDHASPAPVDEATQEPTMSPSNRFGKRSFAVKRFRAGYAPKEVDSFLAEVDDEFKRLSAERSGLLETLAGLQPSADTSKDEVVVSVLSEAEKLRSEALRSANMQREKILNEALNKAKKLVEAAELRRKTTLQDLEQQRRDVKLSIQSLHEFEHNHRTQLASLMEDELTHLRGDGQG